MKVVSSVGFFGDAIGRRISITYSVIDEQGKVISDNNRLDRVVVDQTAVKNINKVIEFAQELIDAEE